jgi:hypothetical protein
MAEDVTDKYVKPENAKSERKFIKNKQIGMSSETTPETYRLQVRLSAYDHKRLEKEAIDSCTAMSMLGALAIHDWLDEREKKKKIEPK